MQKFKVIVFGAIIFTYLKCVQTALEDNFEDADKNNDYSSSGNNEKWDLRHTIPGEPDIDYPIYAYPIKTSFSCDNRHQGYYADVEARCQVFRICTNTALSDEGFSFLCPNGTLFSQKNFVCDWYRNVDCNDSENFYFKNEEIGKNMNHDKLMETVKEIVEYPMRTISKALGFGGSKTPSHLKGRNNTSIGATLVNTITNNTNGEKSLRNHVNDHNEKANIDVRSDLTGNLGLNAENQKTPTKYIQQVQQKNDNRGQIKHGRPNQTSKIKSTSASPLTANNNKEQIDLKKFTLPDKVYVNTLGELSTDVGSNFDIKTSYVIKTDADSIARGTKKSLDDVLGDSEAYKNHLKNQQREKLREGLQGSVNERFVTTSTRTTPKIAKNINEDNLQVQSDTKLSFAASVNAGLTNLQNTKTVNTVKVDKLNDNYLNLADNINTGLFNSEKKTPKIEIPETIKKQEDYHRTVNIESRLSTSSKGGQSFQGIETAKIKTINPNNYRNGRQFKFLGSGFTRSGETDGITVEPYTSNLKNTAYLPPLQKSGDNNKESLLIQLNNEENLKNLLLDINNINNSSSNPEVSLSNIDEIHVKKRAEELLLKGVHQTLYENDQTTNNIIINKTIIDENNLNEITKINSKMIIRVYDDEEINELNKINNTEKPYLKNIFKLTTELTAGPIIITDSNINTDKNPINLITETVTDSEIITSTNVIPKNVVESSTNSDIYNKDRTEQIHNKKYIKFRKFNNNLNDRRQTVKPIIYSKKPYTLSTYPKLSTTTIKPYKYLENRRNNYRNRLIGNKNINKDLPIVSDTIVLRKNYENDLNDLTAVANTYGLSNKYQNNTKYTLLRRIKPTSHTKTIISSTTTTLPNISNLNLTSISNFVPFGLNHFNNKNNDNNIQINLQNSDSYIYNNNNNNIKQHQQIDSKNQKFYYSIGTQNGNQNNDIIKPIGSYTEIPGTNIKISKSNEETSFILSSDPRHQPQIIKQTQNINKNGYVPLNEYITNTLNNEIKTLATQTPNSINYINLNNNQQNINLLNKLLPQFTTISPNQQQQYQQPINFGLNNDNSGLTNIPHKNYGYQITGTTAKPYGYHDLISDNLKNSFNTIGGPLIHQQQNQQQYIQNDNNPKQSYYNNFNNKNLDLLISSTTQKPLTNVNIYNNLSDGSVILPDISINTNDNYNPNLQSNYQNFIFNPLPIAQRRLDVVKDDEKESEIYNKAITSYNVPIGSIGRLGKQLALQQRKS